jgi:hypothetical protein
MKRFRFTFLAVCLILVWLGWTDISFLLENRSPETVSIQRLESAAPPQAWLHITGGRIDLVRAISTSGSVELDGLLVPLQSEPGGPFQVLLETRDPQLLQLFHTYHFGFDSVFEQALFLRDNENLFRAPKDVTGMHLTGRVTTGNRTKLMQIAEAVKMDVPEDVLLISEGMEPPRYRGFFFAIVGVLGLVRLATRWSGGKPEPASENDLTLPPKG